MILFWRGGNSELSETRCFNERACNSIARSFCCSTGTPAEHSNINMNQLPNIFGSVYYGIVECREIQLKL